MKQLDITDVKAEGADLYREIEAAVRDTQRVIVQDYPSEILMTPWQYEQLCWITGNDYDLYDAENRVITTKDNMMEIRVKGYKEGVPEGGIQTLESED